MSPCSGSHSSQIAMIAIDVANRRWECNLIIKFVWTTLVARTIQMDFTFTHAHEIALTCWLDFAILSILLWFTSSATIFSCCHFVLCDMIRTCVCVCVCFFWCHVSHLQKLFWMHFTISYQVLCLFYDLKWGSSFLWIQIWTGYHSTNGGLIYLRISYLWNDGFVEF